MENKLQSQIQEGNIDLGKLVSFATGQKKEIITIVVGCTIAAAGISFFLPKQYESTALVQTRNTGKDISGVMAMASVMGIDSGASTNSSLSYIELMKSRRV